MAKAWLPIKDALVDPFGDLRDDNGLLFDKKILFQNVKIDCNNNRLINILFIFTMKPLFACQNVE